MDSEDSGFEMKIRAPPRKIREKFLLTYELEGCQKAVDFLTKYYRIRRMKIVLDGRRVGNGDIAVYFQNRAYFTKRGLTKRTVLHEFYHHLVSANGQEIPNRIEEREANNYVQKVLGSHS
jgi:hypothetical protein